MLKPSQFGLNETKFPNITFGLLFQENAFISKEIFETNFAIKINFLDYANIKQITIKNFLLSDGNPKHWNHFEMPSYFKSKLF